MRADDPAVEGDGEYQQHRARSASRIRARRLCRVTANVAPTAIAERPHAGHVAGGVGVAGRGEQIQRLLRPRPADDDLGQRGAAPAEHDDQDQRHRELAQPVPERPQARCRPAPRTRAPAR